MFKFKQGIGLTYECYHFILAELKTEKLNYE